MKTEGRERRVHLGRNVPFPAVKPALAANRDLIDG